MDNSSNRRKRIHQSETDELYIRSIVEKQIIIKDWIIEKLDGWGIRYCDKRNKNGCLWILGGDELSVYIKICEAQGYEVRYRVQGCREFPNSPVWWTKTIIAKEQIKIEEQSSNGESLNKLKWDKFETAKLLETHLIVMHGILHAREAYNKISELLRNYGTLRGYIIDDKYRNLNGINTQIQYINYLYTDGRKGLKGAGRVFTEIVTVYKNNPLEFYSIIQEANEVMKVDRRERFFSELYTILWLPDDLEFENQYDDTGKFDLDVADFYQDKNVIVKLCEACDSEASNDTVYASVVLLPLELYRYGRLQGYNSLDRLDCENAYDDMYIAVNGSSADARLIYLPSDYLEIAKLYKTERLEFEKRLKMANERMLIDDKERRQDQLAFFEWLEEKYSWKKVCVIYMVLMDAQVYINRTYPQWGSIFIMSDSILKERMSLLFADGTYIQNCKKTSFLLTFACSMILRFYNAKAQLNNDSIYAETEINIGITEESKPQKTNYITKQGKLQKPQKNEQNDDRIQHPSNLSDSSNEVLVKKDETIIEDKDVERTTASEQTLVSYKPHSAAIVNKENDCVREEAETPKKNDSLERQAISPNHKKSIQNDVTIGFVDFQNWLEYKSLDLNVQRSIVSNITVAGILTFREFGKSILFADLDGNKSTEILSKIVHGDAFKKNRDSVSEYADLTVDYYTEYLCARKNDVKTNQDTEKFPVSNQLDSSNDVSVKKVETIIEEKGVEGMTIAELTLVAHESYPTVIGIIREDDNLIEIGSRVISINSLVDWEEAANEINGILMRLLRKTPIVSKHLLYQEVKASLDIFLNDNDLDSENYVYDLARFFFEKKKINGIQWGFDGSNIGENKNIASLSAEEIVIEYAKEINAPILRKDVENLIQRVGLNTSTIWSQLVGNQKAVFFLYDIDMAILKETIPTDPSWLGRISDIISDCFQTNQVLIPFRILFNEIEPLLPPLQNGVKWTLMLFQNIVGQYKTQFAYRLISGKKQYNTIPSFMIRKDSELDSFADCLAAWLKSQQYHDTKISQMEMRKYLVKNQIISSNEYVHNLPTILGNHPCFIWSHDKRTVQVILQ